MRCAVLGSPIAHSLSPALHLAAYQQLGLDWSYEAVEVEEAGLASFLSKLDDQWRGVSLTMPLKRAVVANLDSYDDWVARSGVANTVVLSDGLRGANTDIPGAMGAITERIPVPTSAVILGGGATAASVGLALAELGCSAITLAVRSAERAAVTVETIASHRPGVSVMTCTFEQLPATDLTVSTIPVTAQQDLTIPETGAVFEVVYDPWPSRLVETAAHRGIQIVSGLDLLAHQAALQVELMTGRSVEVRRLREAGERALAKR